MFPNFFAQALYSSGSELLVCSHTPNVQSCRAPPLCLLHWLTWNSCSVFWCVGEGQQQTLVRKLIPHRQFKTKHMNQCVNPSPSMTQSKNTKQSTNTINYRPMMNQRPNAMNHSASMTQRTNTLNHSPSMTQNPYTKKSEEKKHRDTEEYTINLSRAVNI